MKSFFTGKTAIVTGASGGVGRETVRQYLKNGTKVFMIDVNDNLRDFEKDLKKEYASIEFEAEVMDICNLDDCRAVANRVYEKWGRIDFVASIAGALHDAVPIKNLEPEVWDAIFNTNVKGPMLLCKAVLPYMENAKAGNIVTVSSWWGHRGYAFFSAYCASKAAMIKFTQSLAEEMAEFGGRANVICPGNINTRMHQKALEDEAVARNMHFDEVKEKFWNAIPLKKPAEPVDIANGILFLNSDQATYITGETLNINGGCDIR